MSRKYFGTDGIRGTVGEPPITPDFVLKLGWAAGRVLAAHGGSKILIGKDTRISGYMFESALEAGISAAGVDVRLLGPMPTPAIAYLTRTLHAQAGIVISASHNAYTDNGIKFFGDNGRKLSDKIEAEIERMLDEPISVVATDRLGKVRRIDDARGRYIEFCKSTTPGLNLHGLKIVVDTANGAAYHITPDVLEELGAEVVAIANQPDGFNINLECGSTKPEALCRRVVAEGADLGLALDGDADRLIMVDDQGTLVDGDQLLYLIARDRQRRGRLNGGVGRHPDVQPGPGAGASGSGYSLRPRQGRRPLRDGAARSAWLAAGRRVVRASGLPRPHLHRRRHRGGPAGAGRAAPRGPVPARGRPSPRRCCRRR